MQTRIGTRVILAAMLAGASLLAAPLTAQQAPPRYQAKVPPSITTPDRLETQLLGRLEFRDGMPTQATADKAPVALS